MAVYIDREEIKDIEHIDAGILRYVITKHQNMIDRYDRLKQYYMVKNPVFVADTKNHVKVNVGYAKYIVDVTLGYYLGDPIKYDTKDKNPEDKPEDVINPGSVEAVLKNGRLVRHSQEKPDYDISKVISAYNKQTISDIDAKIGKDLGIYGEAYELEYASDDKVPYPKSVECDPRTCIMVRDTTVEHHKLFFLMYEKREKTDNTTYYRAYVYTDKTVTVYETSNVSTFDFVELPELTKEHFFGQVPAVEYSNNSDRLGDFECEISLINAYNSIMSDRVTDKNEFIDSIIAIYGAELTKEMKEDIKTNRIVSGMPTDSKIEYVQQTMEESEAQILADNIVREIHKQSMTVDMTDENFSGNASGQALKLKLLTMNMLVKNKIRNMEKGLKKRFEMYNQFLNTEGEMDIVDKEVVNPIFTISIPINEAEIVNTVVSLQDIVDEETLLQQLWFIKDPKAVLAKVREQRELKTKQYMDTFNIAADANENTKVENNIDNKVKSPVDNVKDVEKNVDPKETDNKNTISTRKNK